MLIDVTIWEGRMRDAAGTVAADPRYPDVKAKLQEWNGDVEVMATLQLAIEPSSANCDAFISAISGAVYRRLKTNGFASIVASTPPIQYCESFPGIFERMKRQVSERLPHILDQQCKLSWLTDQYFEALANARAIFGAPTSTPNKPRVQDASTGTPAPGQELLARRRCSALFEVGDGPPEGRQNHGDLLDPLVIELDAIIYREGRQARQGGK